MKLTRTPSKYRKHDYSLVLSREELLALNGESDLESVNKATDSLWSLIEREAKRLGEQQGE